MKWKNNIRKAERMLTRDEQLRTREKTQYIMPFNIDLRIEIVAVKR